MKRREFLPASGVGFAVMAVWLGLVIRASAQTPAPVATALPEAASEIPLYSGAAPGSEKWDWSERSVTTPTGLPMAQDVVLCWFSGNWTTTAVGQAVQSLG